VIVYTPIKVPLAEKLREESTYYALIIGIDKYSDPALSTLDNSVSDAQRLYDVLTTYYTFERDNIQFLRDAKREEIIYALDYLIRRVTPNDNLLIYYSGHGQYDKDANVGFWLPSNARRISTADWFGNSQLVDFLKRIDSKHTLLITDACFSGSIFKTKSAFSEAPLAIDRLYELPSRKAMTSGTLTEVPDESFFAKYLVDRLKNNKEQYYSAEQLFSNLRIAVINNSDAIPQYGEIQNVGDQGGDFIFIRK
ncbi:MAG: caspase family protein, partial [Bacteroidales bacterium]|nr:caspase family protein [Bacteroidales bacterium]